MPFFIKISTTCLAILALLMGCGKQIVVPKISPPIEWLSCKDEPAAPDIVTPESTVRYMMDLRAAWFDCHDKLNRVKDFHEK